jgi:hypothetical protein
VKALFELARKYPIASMSGRRWSGDGFTSAGQGVFEPAQEMKQSVLRGSSPRAAQNDTDGVG